VLPADDISARVPAVIAKPSLGYGFASGSSQLTRDITSEPSQAFVYVNGNFVGNSPVDVRVNRQVPHRVEIRKPGFLSEEVTLFPAYKDDEKPFVIFGPFQTAGLYRDLGPNPVSLTLLYEGLRDAPETLTSAEATRLLERIQKDVANGEMTEDEAALAERQVLGRVE